MATGLDDIKSVFNIAGVPSDDFIEEVTDSLTQKYNQLYGAFLIGGLPGDPAFGMQIGDLIGEQNSGSISRVIDKQAEDRIPELTMGITYEKSVVQQVPERQYLGMDFYFVDQDSQESILIPLGYKT